MHTTQCRALRVAALFLLFLITPLWAQDRDAPRDTTFFHSSPTALYSAQKRQNAYNRYMIGFNWGQLPKDSNLTKGLRISTIHELLFEVDTSSSSYAKRRKLFDEELPWGMGFIHSSDRISQGTPFPYVWAPALQYDPVIGGFGNAYSFTPRIGDTTGAAWGFGFRDTQVGLIMTESLPNSETDNYGRMQLTDARLRQKNTAESITPDSLPRLILARVQPDNLLHPQDFVDDLKKKFDEIVRHPDNITSYNKTDMYVRDWQLGYYSLPFYRNHNGTPDTVNAPNWLDTDMRGGDTTMLHMKGDSTEWWLAVNLRRLANPDQVSTPSNRIVLALRVPYVVRYDAYHYNASGQLISITKGVRHDTVYARFDSTAVAGNTFTHSHYGRMDKTLGAYDSTIFYIRAGMIPLDTATISNVVRPDIALSGHFWLPKFANNSRYQTFDDHRTFPSDSTNDPPIAMPPPLILPSIDTVRIGVERVNMEVVYHGGVDIGLDWLRFESRLARMLLRGFKDTRVQWPINSWYRYLDTHAVGRGFWVHSHFMADEADPSYYRTQRHVSRLLESAGTVETDVVFRGQYGHETQDRQHWVAWGGLGPQTAAPFIRYGAGTYNPDASGSVLWLKRADRAMGLAYGYKGSQRLNSSNQLEQPFREYETGLGYYQRPWLQDTAMAVMSDSSYNYVLEQSHSIQAVVERDMLHSMINNTALLYSNRPSWFNVWAFGEWNGLPNAYSDNTTRPYTPYWTFMRPKTGEEIRLTCWMPVVLGGKGLLYYKGASSAGFDSAENRYRGQFGLVCEPSADSGSGRFYPTGQTTGPLGGDFLDNLHVLNRFVKRDSMAYAMGIEQNRFYIGTASVYNEIASLNATLDDNSAELMRLRLQAVYSKGFKLTETVKDSTVNMSNFLDLPHIYVLPGEDLHTGMFNMVRRIHTRTGSPCTNCYENWRDSTFYMVTLLKDSAQNMPMDKLFYVGVVNRRVDPTVYRTVSGGTHLGDSIRFFSTVEFDSLRVGNNLTNYAYPDYAQHGSREITLPFNYKLSSGYSLLHIEEVGGTLDTVIGQDKALALMFKPGEGKLLRVNVLKPGDVADGKLDYNGQRKIVAQELPGDSVCYHMAYYRKESNGKRRVYYSRSKGTTRNSPGENIAWETPVVLSDSSLGSGTSIKNGDCAYPSIVVRYDSVAGKDRVYIVYACNKTNSHNEPIADGEHHIVENTFVWNTSNSTLTKEQKNRGRIIKRSQGDTLEHWGTPVVNASAYGNFYAWADSVMGIGIGYKRPQDTFLTYTTYARWGSYPDSAQHPSLNSYSRISLGDNTCSLVWQENNNIYFARPKYTTAGGIQLQSLTQFFQPPIPGRLNVAGTIAKLTDDNCCAYNRMPVIYRSVETGSTWRRWGQNMPMSRERVFWEGKDSMTAPRSKIYRGVVDLSEMSGSFEIAFAAVPTPASISGGIYKLGEPDVAQGAVWYKQYTSGSADTVNGSDSAYVLNFSGNFGVQPASTNRIWHVPLPYGWRQGGKFGIPKASAVLLDRGQYPHLATMKLITPTSDWWVNRRVLQKGMTPDIVASAQYYYRTILPRADDALTQMLGYKKGNGSCDKYLISDIYIDDSPLAFYEPYYEFVNHPDTILVQRADTIKSDWFSIGSTREVSFFGTGSDTSFVGMELVRQSTGARTPITLKPSSSETTATLVVQTFTNGGGEHYRLELFRRTTTASFVDDMYVGQIPYDSLGTFTYGKGSASSGVIRGDIVNLAISGTSNRVGLHAYVYPNPAQDRVSISVYRTYAENMAVTGEGTGERLLVRIVSVLGTEIARFDAQTGDQIELPVKTLPKGVYFVRVEQVGNPGESGTTSFVVE